MIKSRQGHNEAASGDAAIAPRLRLENPWRRDAELVSKNRKSLASKATRWLVWTAVFLICVTAKTVANPLFFFGAILYTFLLLAAGVCCIVLTTEATTEKLLRLSGLLWCVVLGAGLSPVGISLEATPGLPHFVPYIAGKPGPEEILAAERGECVLGGCFAFTVGPSWALVW
jgi:hypothetical protein